MTTKPLPVADKPFVATLPHALVIEVVGSDAATVINNLSTNDIHRLENGSSCEAFVTDVKGWVVAHCVVLRQPSRILLLGLHEDPTRVANHIDRYIIREDAKLGDRSDRSTLLVVDGPQAAHDLAQLLQNPALAELQLAEHHFSELQWDGAPLLAARIPLLSPSSTVLCCPQEQAKTLWQGLLSVGFCECSAEEFELRRIANFWPLSPQDIPPKSIPQELDRDPLAISFSKGCYLGQETIARLDARGQLQKKLCLVEIDGSEPLQVGTSILHQEQEVGRLTSVASDAPQSRTLGLALLRRGHFQPGSTLQCLGRSLQVLPKGIA